MTQASIPKEIREARGIERRDRLCRREFWSAAALAAPS